MKRLLLTIMVIFCASSPLFAQKSEDSTEHKIDSLVLSNLATNEATALKKRAKSNTEYKIDSLILDSTVAKEVKNLERRGVYRIDRSINKDKFVFKGESMAGITVSYGTINSEDSDLGLIIDNINLNGSSFSLKPFYGYTYSDNNAIGVRLGYTYTEGVLDNAGVNLGAANDVNLSISNMGYSNRAYSMAVFHRSYMPLDKKSRFGLFAEWEFSGSFSRSQFDYKSGESVKSGISDNYKVKIGFAPGVAMYVFPNVCACVSFGLGGFQYKHIRQTDAEHNYTGERDFSKLQFGLNLADINIGVTIHLWNKKKDK